MPVHPHAPAPTVALGPFLAALNERMGAMQADELRTAVAGFAQSLAPSQRRAFLEAFNAPAPCPHDEVAALALAIDVLEEEAASTGEPGWDEQEEFADRYGWSVDDELASPEWAPEVIELLRRAGRLLMAGEAASAADAYARLLRISADAVHQGWSIASDLDGTATLREAAACYLRVLSDVTSPNEGPECLRAAIAELSVLVRG